MCEFTQDDQEDDEGGDPAPTFIEVDDFVSKTCDYKRCAGEDYNAGETRHIIVQGIQKLCAHEDVDR